MPDARRVAFVCPRFADGPTVGGAETLLRELALRTRAAGRQVTFLTTCATNHFTWENELAPGRREVRGLEVCFFPVDTDRDTAAFLDVQERISRGGRVTPDEEGVWLANSVHSSALTEHLRTEGDAYDRIVMGPYLFGLVHAAAAVLPEKTLLVPCLHDEPFAYLDCFHDMFRSVRGFLFNSEPERALAERLYGLDAARAAVVGIGLEPFEADPERFGRQRGIQAPYVIYSGRREPLKGTPLLLGYMDAFRTRTGRDVKLVLTGSGPVVPPPGLASHVVDAGFLDEGEKRDAMAGAAAFCHPSVNESLSIVALESWLARTPLLVHAGCAVLRHHCRASRGGLWFRSYPEFEEELQLLLDRPELAARLGEQGRSYVMGHYTWQKVEPRLLAALDG